MSEVLQITVMAGGPSAEREVSLRSGAAVLEALQSLGHAVKLLDPSDTHWTLSPQTDVVFLALHGTYGEDGTVQRQLEGLGVPYTGCGPEASRIAFDKVATKNLLLSAGVPTAPFQVIGSRSATCPPGWRPPFVLKPVRQGSSVGLQFVDHLADWAKCLTATLEHDHEALLEPKIEGREMTVGILADEALPIVEVRPKKGSYDYANKYTPGATEYLCPAPLETAAVGRIQQAGLRAFRAVGGRDYGRVDIMVRHNDEPVVLEVNTLPGMTSTSLFPKAAAAAGINYARLCQKMIDLAMERTARLRR